MTIMSQLLNPQRNNVSRVQVRPGVSNPPASATTPNVSTSASSQRVQTPQPGQAETNTNELPRNFSWTPLPNNLPGWSVPASPSGSPGSRRNAWDYFRVSKKSLGLCMLLALYWLRN